MKLTPEIKLRLELAKSHGRLTRWDTLAKALKCTEEEAKGLLNQYRAKIGDRVRGELEPVVEEEKPKRDWIGTATKVSDWMVDKGTILVAVVLALVLCSFSLWIMGPSTFEKIGFVAVAFVIVLFGLRALIRGNFWLWVRCEFVAWFLGVSFILVGLDYQTNLSADDRQLTALETAETNAKTYLETLQGLQATKGEGYKSQVEAQQKVFETASALAGEYRVQVANKPREAPQIKAYDILLAIPKAVLGSGAKLTNDMAMWIALGLFGLVFYILPETLYTTVVRREE